MTETNQPQDDSGNPAPPTPQVPPVLPQRWALILLAAFVIACIFGGLTFVQFGLAAGLLTALTAGGATVKGLHELLGP
jgi:hypothetical protein